MTRKCESPNHEGMPASRRARPLHTPLPPLPLPRSPCTSSNRDTRVPTRNHPGVDPRRGGALRGCPPSHHPKPPPTTRAHSAGRPELETVGRGEGGLSRSPGTGQREWGLPIPAPGSRILHAFKGAAADYSGREPYPPRQPTVPSLHWDQGCWGSLVKGGGSQEILS